MKRLTRLGRDESGMTFIFVGLGLVALLSASMLAIDVGMLMTARSQAQNSADAGALAGATALVYDSYTDRSNTGPAKTSAVDAALANRVMSRAVSVTPADVEFPTGPNGEPNRVRVTVTRTGANAVSTLVAASLAPFFGDHLRTVGIGATATAEASPANAMTCVKPFTIPDRWTEMQTAPWDGLDTYDAFDSRGRPLANPDIYIPAGQSGYTGYNQESARGQRLEIRAATGNNITVSFYFSLALGKPAVTGGAEYDWNIANCNTTVYRHNDLLTSEPGAMTGPTVSGAQLLVDRDPGAYWDTATNRVRGSAFGTTQSPRIFPIPLYDPIYYDEGKRNGRNADLRTANWIGFFIEEIQGNGIWGRIMPITGIIDQNAGPAPEGIFPMAIRLVR